MNNIIGVLALLLAIWQLYIGWKGFKVYKTTARKTDHPMRVFGYLYSFFFAVVLIIVALAAFFGGF